MIKKLPIPAILALAMAFCLLPTHAAVKTVNVSLFKAQGLLQQLLIVGPFELKRPGQTQNFSSGHYELQRRNDCFIVYARLSETKKLEMAKFRSSSVQLHPINGSIFLGCSSEKGHHYRGEFTIMASGNNLLCTNEVSLRDYVCSVVGSETVKGFPLEALKAQSILVQTAMKRYRSSDDLNDSTEKQAYLGCDYELPEVKAAVETTWGEWLSEKNKPVPIFFHSACAGQTSSSALFTGQKVQLACDRSVKCRYCQASPFWKPTRTRVSAQIYKENFPEGLPEVLNKDPAGRPMYLRFPATKDKKEETGYQFWLRIGQKLGWDKIPGTRFELKKLSNGDIELISTGAGHGVGLCQWGAAGMAREGYSYEKILNYYLPGATLIHTGGAG